MNLFYVDDETTMQAEVCISLSLQLNLVNLIVGRGLDDRHLFEMHRHAVVRHQRNADLDGVVVADGSNGNLRLVERFEHVLDFGDDEV